MLAKLCQIVAIVLLPQTQGDGQYVVQWNAKDLKLQKATPNQGSSFVTFMIRTSTINQINLSNEKRDPERCLGYIGDKILPSYVFLKTVKKGSFLNNQDSMV